MTTIDQTISYSISLCCKQSNLNDFFSISNCALAVHDVSYMTGVI